MLVKNVFNFFSEILNINTKYSTKRCCFLIVYNKLHADERHKDK